MLTRRVDNPDTPLIGNLKYLAYERVVAISSAVRTQLEAQGVPAAKLATIRSSVTAADCVPVWPREKFLAEFGIEPGQRTVAIVAQLIPRKGHALFLKAWPLIRAQCPDARLLIFGSGPLEAELKSRTGWGGTTSFCGLRADLREFLGHRHPWHQPAREGAHRSLEGTVNGFLRVNRACAGAGHRVGGQVAVEKGAHSRH